MIEAVFYRQIAMESQNSISTDLRQFANKETGKLVKIDFRSWEIQNAIANGHNNGLVAYIIYVPAIYVCG